MSSISMLLMMIVENPELHFISNTLGVIADSSADSRNISCDQNPYNLDIK